MNRITQYFPDDELFAEENVDETRLFAFDGRDLDPDVELQHLKLRHFDPAVGKWLEESGVRGHRAGVVIRNGSGR